MKMLFVVLMVFFLSYNAFAQNITGKVEDLGKHPIPNVAVVLYKTIDSSYIAGTITSEDGSFTLHKTSTNCQLFLRVSSLGYKSEARTIAEDSLGTIMLAEDSKMLEGVTVIGNRIVNNANGYSLQLQNTGLENSSTAQDVFAFLPGMSIEQNRINLMGKQPVIYVNGMKITSQNELAALSPKRIAKIEVRYFSVGEGANKASGTIWITTKKEINGGFSGYLQESVSEMPKYGHIFDSPTFVFDASLERLSMNYYAIYSHQKLLEDVKNEYKYDSGDELSYDSRTRSWSNVFANRLNLSYELSKKSTIALSEYIGNTDVKNRQFNNYISIHGPQYDFTQQTVAKYILATDDKGSNFEITADFLGNKQHQTQKETVGTENSSSNYMGKKTSMYRVAPKLTDKVTNGNELQLGLNYQYIQSSDETEAQENKMDGYISSAYINYSGSVKNIMYALGLTWQYNHMEVSSNGDKSSYSGNYLCPQANLMWMLNRKTNTMLALMYQRTVESMPYSVLSAYRNYSTPNHYTTGNASLRTPNDHQLMLRFALGRHLVFTWMYERIEDDIYFDHGIDEQNPSITWSRPENANYNQVVGARVEYTVDPTKWWKIKLQSAIQQTRFSTLVQTVTGKYCGKFWFNNIFEFSQTFGATFKAYWETGTSFENYSWRPVGNIATSLWKTACKEKLRFAFNSTIWARGRKAKIVGEGYTSFYANTTKNTSFDITITWNFRGGKKVKQCSNAESIQEFQSITEKK